MALISRIRNLFLGPDQEPFARTNSDQERRAAMHYAQMGHLVTLAADHQIAGWDSLSYAHPIRQITERSYASGLEHEAQLLIFHLMRQYIPTLDAAIKNRRILEGDCVITSKDAGLERALTEWAESVPVGYIGGRATLKGLNTYLWMLSDNADEYGLTAGEIVADERGREIRRLVAPNVRTLSLADDDRDDIYELYQMQKGRRRRIDDNPLVHVLTFTYSNEGPWPVPMAWSLVKSSEAVLRMYESVINAWWRFGDPSLLTGIEYTDPEQSPQITTVSTDTGSVEVPSALLMLKQSLEGVMKARRSGKVGDAYFYTDAGGTLRQEVIGDIDASMVKYFREMENIFGGHIVAHSDTPSWMYPNLEQKGEGLGSARSNNQALLCAIAAHRRNRGRATIAREVIDTYLLLSGDARYIGRYAIDFESANLLDDQYEAQARKTQAEADQIIIQNSFELFQPGGTQEDEDGNAPAGPTRMTDEQLRYLEEKGVLRPE